MPKRQDESSMSTHNGIMSPGRSTRASDMLEGRAWENVDSGSHPRPATTMSNSSSKTSIATPQSPLADLVTSPNNIAAGIGQVLEALVLASTATTTKPIMVEYGNRVMALGRKRMGVMSGRNAFIYLRSKFGILNTNSALYLEALIIGEDEFVEVDFDAWEELVPHISKLRIIS
ncbi:hypothetical protein K443DRAFT_83368 [Laccaria amethystina LaAM-08-1]|uniref:Uncharacterized protein n=1 Tax=Laccaria amethystina LaAM-08-1 TaxID=1095629 RepID=A0A0C9Y5H3_9AGAR|nr:hypothetical protein K443DRAFT_83368 [Laccaria amethystina LaAM-08-1]